MKYKSLFIVFFIGIIFFSGCGEKTDQQIIYEAHKLISNLETYSCTAKVTVYGNKDPQVYVMNQWFKRPNMYRIEIIEPEELKDKTTIYNGHKAFIFHPRIGQEWMMTNFKNSMEEKMFIGYFIKSFVDSEDAEATRGKIDGKEYIMLNTEIPGNNPYFYSEKLWFDIHKFYPYRLQVLDAKDNLRIDIEYYNLKINDKIEEDTFTIKENL